MPPVRHSPSFRPTHRQTDAPLRIPPTEAFPDEGTEANQIGERLKRFSFSPPPGPRLGVLYSLGAGAGLERLSAVTNTGSISTGMLPSRASAFCIGGRITPSVSSILRAAS